MIINPMMPLVVLLTIAAITLWLLLALPTRVLRVLGIVAIALTVMVGMRPMVPNGETTGFKNNVDVIFVMDNTLSMLAEDYDGNQKRIDGVAKDIDYIIESIPGAYYSLISFDNKSTINLRSTVDAKAVATAVKTVHKVDDFYAKGSAITVFKEDLRKVLESSSKKEGRKRAVFIMTDGENTAEAEMESLEDLRGYIDGGAVLGYGTEKGGKMKIKSDEDDFYGSNYTMYDDDGYLRDWSSGEYPAPLAVSMIDEDNLRKMADQLGVEYIHMDKQDNVKEIVDSTKSFQEMAEGEDEYAYDDIYYFFCWPLIGIMLVMLYLMKKEYLW